jgi:hypothetical protein
MKKQKQTHYAEIVYVSGKSMKYENLTERQAKRIHDAHVRDMAIRSVKRVSYHQKRQARFVRCRILGGVH